MFGSKKIQELEAQLNGVKEELNQVTAQRDDLTRQLEDAQRQIAALEAQLNDFDLAREREEARASKAEYEGLKALYARKNQEFDDAREGEEQSFAREQALKRHNLENEIRDNRQANQEYVAETVRTFGESYNYYLNQIKVLVDALGAVATRTGETLFAAENGDLKARFGNQMRDTLKSGMGALGAGNGDYVVISADDREDAAEETAESEEADDTSAQA